MLRLDFLRVLRKSGLNMWVFRGWFHTSNIPTFRVKVKWQSKLNSHNKLAFITTPVTRMGRAFQPNPTHAPVVIYLFRDLGAENVQLRVRVGQSFPNRVEQVALAVQLAGQVIAGKAAERVDRTDGDVQLVDLVFEFVDQPVLTGRRVHQLRDFVVAFLLEIGDRLAGHEIAGVINRLTLEATEPREFREHRVLRGAALLIVVIGWNAHDIGRIHGENHQAQVVLTCPRRSVLIRGEVQTVGAGTVAVVVHLTTGHRNHLAHLVFDGARVDILVVVTNRLVGDDIAVLVDHEAVGDTEQEQLVLRRLGRIETHLAQEVEQRLGSVAGVDQLEHLFGDGERERFTVELDVVVAECERRIAQNETLDRGTNVHEVDCFLGVAGAECVTDLREVRVIGRHREVLATDEGGQTRRRDEKGKTGRLGH